ncbi:MAG: ribosomal RNA small subunit methyltransferase A [Candidatus Magasanikbacteria bacterium CG10_big_fil_rev_8_21_14_0_10_36_16]|uniref:Ribosomal RNA small subunit methyltransferase A n=1 Tax=Candidatus Magasanikbacteria bacterium CG10_big_fil_rev_8_21_14_0_10_36_16 TaxID=1974645 RepID=A0A2H0TY27_9BACT|nr:MAG: ribosomal RNA small subunit methyltransferase A [Candidatus Magasanikbacteria bacterium CG10_big_fil_rev_8_21_14_0_10_36_16]
MDQQNLYKPSYLIELCKKYNLSPSKKYGQNYLMTKIYIDKMLEAGEINKEDLVVEVGLGFGVLTFALVEKAGKVVAFEIEQKLKDYWEENKSENLEIVWGDVMRKFNEVNLKKYKLIANLPYQITSGILRMFLEMENKPEKIVVMVQKEVAERITAKKGDMSVLAISVQYYGQPRVVAKVTKGNFWPSPKVDSAVLLIDNIKSPQNDFSDEYFFTVVKAGFVQKRKQLWRNLSQGLNLDGEKIKSILQEICGNDKIRAEELGVEEWVKIANNIK